MTTAELLARLRDLKIKIRADNDRLVCSGAREALTPDLRAALSERKAEILAVLRHGGAKALSAEPPLQRMPRNEKLPLSFSQKRLWFIDQLEPASALYNISRAFRLRGFLNRVSLERGLNEIVQRHEALRTTFSNVEGRPLQIISPSLTVPMPVIDLTDRSVSEREKEALRLLDEEVGRPFDLARGPLLRALLVRLATDHHILLLVMHHIVSDGWSMAVLYRELGALYNAFCGGRPSPLSELAIQYADFAHWQRNRLQGEELEAQLSYWKRQLRDLPVLELSNDRPRPAAQSYRGARRSIVMPKALAKALEALSRQKGATLFMTLLAAFQTLLCRYTGQKDIAVGTPIANRSRIEFEGLIGFFLNTLVLRTDLSGDPSFEDLVDRVREMTLDAYTHQDLPFEKLVEELQPERDLNRNPLFQVLFVLHNNPPIDPKFSGLALSPVQVEAETAKFDLSLFITPAEEGLLGTLAYSTDLFDGDTVARMMVHFQTLLEGIAANPRRRLSNLPLLGKSDLDRLLVDWNNAKTDYADGNCVHDLFEAQVQRTPHEIAALFGDEQLTYQELDQRAGRLARRLRSLGVGPEVRVGLCMERSLQAMIGLLAVLKAGGAYVPLDPAFPKERLAFMLEDARVSVLLSDERLAGNLPEHRATVIYPAKDGESAPNDLMENPGGEPAPANLAYVIYTSGSTGKPKAVAMTHGPLFNLISWQLRNLRQPVPARTLQFASLGFDVSFQEIFTTWCSGGTLILIAEELRQDSAALLRFLREKSVARVFLPFVALRQLAEAADEDADTCADLREIITAGEQLQATRQIVKWLSRLEDCALRNQYGPSESHVVTAFTPAGSPSDWPALPPIGRPIANAEIFLLDQHLNLVPVGVPGELYIGGDCLARGYLNRPELTAEKFLPHPFSARPGARLYRTGDLARYLPDGEIEFLGRIDNQVKIRGFRIEPGEIESVLAQHPSVRETVVVAREAETEGNDAAGNPKSKIQHPKSDKRLVAYVVSGHDPARISGLRDFLAEKLPDYMIPSAFVFLDALPLTPSGKVDRKALPAPDNSRPDLDNRFVAPRTPAEQSIAKIWAEVLKLEKVGIHDNFFHLGGHSLLATQVISRLRDAFRIHLPLRSLFESPTVAGLAERIDTILWAGKRHRPAGGAASEERDEVKL
jgi:amino acid adenylation domain-containing protein